MTSQPVSFRCDDSLWPLLQVTLPSTWTSDDELADHMRAITGFRRRGRLALVMDCRAAPYPNAAQRHVIAAHTRQAEQQHPGHLYSLAVVHPSVLARGVFLAIQWLAPESRPVRLFSDVAAAVAWSATTLSGEMHAAP